MGIISETGNKEIFRYTTFGCEVDIQRGGRNEPAGRKPMRTIETPHAYQYVSWHLLL